MVFCLVPTLYSVVRIDPVATVEKLDDPEALAAAQRLEAKYYVAYLYTNLELPFPMRPWFKFRLWFVGAGPRPEDPDNGFTSDMYLPIFPNVDHPDKREPIRCNEPFPFPNCSQWAGMAANVRVKKGNYLTREAKGAICTTTVEFMRMTTRLAMDRERAISAVDAREGITQNVAATHAPLADPNDDRESTDDDGRSVNSLDDVVAADPFGINNPEAGEEWLPVVDMWINMAEKITAEQIGHPADFYKERDALIA